MPYPLLADLVVLLHFGFILFAVLGGLLMLRWRWCVWVHAPALLWGALIEFTGGVCPLTPLERSLREASGVPRYEGGFIEHYLLPVIYPTTLTRESQILLGALLLIVNAAIYTWAWRRRAGRDSVPGERPA